LTIDRLGDAIRAQAYPQGRVCARMNQGFGVAYVGLLKLPDQIENRCQTQQRLVGLIIVDCQAGEFGKLKNVLA
jgi:hypothetical protein